MEKLTALAESKTVWALVVMFLVSGLPAIRDQLSTIVLLIADAILALLTAYFHVGAVDQAYDSVVTPSMRSAGIVKRHY